MPQTAKIATCCYCGTRAVLVLDQGRHELSCAGCGAPLHNLKRMPQPAQAPAKPARGARPKRRKPAGKRAYAPEYSRRKPRKTYRKRPKRRWGRELLEELWDIVEDVFD